MISAEPCSDPPYHRRIKPFIRRGPRRGGRHVRIGGTVGDIESLPFLEAIRHMATSGTDKRCFIL